VQKIILTIIDKKLHAHSLVPNLYVRQTSYYTPCHHRNLLRRQQKKIRCMDFLCTHLVYLHMRY